ncbi:Uncharacterised protein [Mycobacteroides abscessus subsp. abscessus]|nr:Uncharacterised protein [Mycobacteroides abscessus subsp. abscessus]SKW02232.1 Uncharacterised protein [Mycobacteroides abscessus subsp. abscessus]
MLRRHWVPGINSEYSTVAWWNKTSVLVGTWAMVPAFLVIAINCAQHQCCGASNLA